MNLKTVLLECLVNEFEIRIYKAELTADDTTGTVCMRAYVVADEASGFLAENDDGSRNNDVTVCNTLNDALIVWKSLVRRVVDNFSL